MYRTLLWHKSKYSHINIAIILLEFSQYTFHINIPTLKLCKIHSSCFQFKIFRHLITPAARPSTLVCKGKRSSPISRWFNFLFKGNILKNISRFSDLHFMFLVSHHTLCGLTVHKILWRTQTRGDVHVHVRRHPSPHLLSHHWLLHDSLLTFNPTRCVMAAETGAV